MSEAEQPTKTYRGNCHCGAYVFEVEAPEITSLSDCKCSICSKRQGGYLWVEKPLTVIKDEGKLVHYSFGPKKVDHQFCGSCGTTVIATIDQFPKVGVNVRALQNLDLWGLEVKPFNADTFDPQYVAPAFLGVEPTPAGFEDGKTYYGSCHCGAVTTAVRVNGSLENGTYKGPIIECNCSFCARGGQVWIYPTSAQLAIHGRENVTYYAFGHRVWRKIFCRTCGVYIATEVNSDQTDDEIAALPEFVRNFRATHVDNKPLNLRVLNGGFDFRAVKPLIRSDGWNREPLYVNP
ncbi:hypothetical protein N657DRAFT_116887 [Parathielavia appendiculata]|uniref:CENP-V/GFA domain-containing protein n=1 Tax=Parathielavia appendiculata TaxID=2587402 RepID=A0AAN6Z1P0_9PEZI|nr:hypothetical protein N657DRAFT_116887 [Parathielavia appendiculata]